MVLHKNNSLRSNKTPKTNTTLASHSLETYYLESNGKIRRSTSTFGLAELQNQAKDLYNKSAKLRNAANNSQGLVRSELLLEAKDLQRLYLLKQIESSELLSKMAFTKFSQSKEKINFLLSQFKGNTNVYKNASTLSDEAGQTMKMAIEMREEAYAMPTIQGEYGTMSNAEEKENLALSMQDQAIGLLEPRSLQNNINSGFIAYAATPYFPKVESLDDLLQDAYDLNSKSQKLNGAAKTSNGLTKTELNKEANYLYRLYELKEIAASELSAKMTYEKFVQNKTIFNTLINNYSGDRNTSGNARNLIADAEKCIKMAKEIREEANAMPTIEAKWGTMSNAEEKETLALNKEDKAINLIKKATPNYTFKINGESMANLTIDTK